MLTSTFNMLSEIVQSCTDTQLFLVPAASKKVCAGPALRHPHLAASLLEAKCQQIKGSWPLLPFGRPGPSSRPTSDLEQLLS